MEIYLDLVVVFNFLVDFFLLLGTNRLSGFPGSPGRCALGAALGGAYSGACLLPGFSFLGNILWRTVFLGLIAMVSFGLSRSAAKRAGVFLLLSMALGGIALSLGRGDMPGLLLASALVWVLCILSFGGTIGGREYIPVTLTWGTRTVSLTALRDTGNTLRDPITGEGVLVVSGEIGQALTGLTAQQLSSPMETMLHPPMPGLRLIPYRAVGCPAGMLLGLRISQVQLNGREQSAIVAFAPEGLGCPGGVQALTGGIV